MGGIAGNPYKSWTDRLKTAVKSVFGKNDDAAILGQIDEFKKNAENARRKYATDYKNIHAYYAGDKSYIFEQWKKMEGWEDWMATFHVNVLAVGVQELNANIIPQWPRPMIVPFRSEYKEIADGGDSLVASALNKGNYLAAINAVCQNMALYNIGFMMPVVDKLADYPHKKIIIESIHPLNVLISSGADGVANAGEVLVRRRIHKNILKGLFPAHANRFDGLAGPDTNSDQSGMRTSTLKSGSGKTEDADDPNNVTIEYYWQRDFTVTKIPEKELKEKREYENRQYFSMFMGSGIVNEDTFDIYDDHVAHYQSHAKMIEYFKKMSADGDSMNPLPGMALEAFTFHNQQHEEAIKMGIKGGEFLKYKYGKRFVIVAAETVVLFDESDPYSEFGIRDIPVIDFRLIGGGGEDYWLPHLGKQLVDLNAERNRVICSICDIMVAHGKPQSWMEEGTKVDDVDNKLNRLYTIRKGGIPPGIIQGANIPSGLSDELARIDRDIQRTLGLFESFRGELPSASMSGVALENLNTQSSKIIDVKLDLQKSPIARLGEAVLKLALKLYSGTEIAITTGEYGIADAQSIDIEELRAIEYQVVAIPGGKDIGPAEQKMTAYNEFMKTFGPILMQHMPGTMLKLSYEIAKGQLPEFERFSQEFEDLAAALEEQPQMPPPVPDGSGERPIGENNV